MKPNRFKEVLAAGAVPVGHMVMEFASRGIPRILEAAGVDFVLFDMEHSSIDLSRIADLLAGCHGTTFAPFVRVPERHYNFLARVMDAGALGVMVANVESAEQAQEVVDAVKYAPMGRRGLGLGAAHNNYVMPEPAEYLEAANRNTTVICQIESVKGVQNADAIASVAGVDVLWVGHFDLTSSMGIVAQFDHPGFLANLAHVVEVTRKHGKWAGIQPGNAEQAAEWMKIGYNVISYGSDIALYRLAVHTAVQQLRKRSTAGSPTRP